MKKLIFLLAGLMFSIVMSAQIYNSINYVSNYNLEADTVEIMFTDLVMAVNISCPSWSSDSVYWTGSTGTLDGHSSAVFTVAPGEDISMGDGINPIAYLLIIAVDKGRLITWKK